MDDHSFTNTRVLIIDDDVFTSKGISASLKTLGISKISTANDGSEAVILLDQDGANFDMVICDLNMPGMDGLAFLRHLSGIQFSGAVLVLSGEDGRILRAASNLAEAHGIRFLGAVPKPITREALQEAFEKLGQVNPAKTRFSDPSIDETELRRGLKADEFVVFYQPKVSTRTRELVGVEALVRWRHPELGIIPPGLFISLAEHTGLINDLTDTVIAKAFRQGGAWHDAGLSIKIAVNLSVDCLERLDLPEFLVNQAEMAGLEPADIILEVTESRLTEEVIKPLEVLTRLSMKEFLLSIDDFGTGYSSMEKLTQFTFSELKIDRAFVHGATNDQVTKSILESCVGLAKSLDLTIVAEGVEDQSDWDLIADLGCHEVQGYFIAKPMPADELADWAKDWARQI